MSSMEFEAFLKEPTASRLAALDDAGVLDRLLNDALDRYWDHDRDGCAARAALVPTLIDAGVEVNRIGSRGVSPLALVIGMDGIDDEQRIELVRRLVAAGADPQLRQAGATTHRASAAGMLADNPGRIPALRPLLEPALTDDGRIDALVGLLIRRVDFEGYAAEAEPWLADLVATVGTLDVIGPQGLAPVHLAALSGDVDLLGGVLARISDPDVAVAGTGRLRVRNEYSVRYKSGMTGIDLVDAALSEIAARSQASDSWDENHRALVEQLTRCRAALTRAGADAVAPPPQPAVRSMDLMRDQWLAAHLVVGKSFGGELDLAVLESMCEDVDALAQRLGVPLVVLYMGQTDATLPDEFARCVVGLHVAEAVGVSLGEIAYRDLARVLDQARALPWDEIVEQVPEGGLRDSLTGDEDDTVEVYGCAVGTVAGFEIGFGVPVELPEDDEDDADEDAAIAELLNRPDGLARVTPDLEIVTGRDQDCRSKPVYGVHVESGAYFGVPIVVDFSAEAHAARMARLGALADRATYYLTSVFD